MLKTQCCTLTQTNFLVTALDFSNYDNRIMRIKVLWIHCETPVEPKKVCGLIVSGCLQLLEGLSFLFRNSD